MVKCFEFSDSQKAWEGLNEYLLLNEEEILGRGGILGGNQIISHNNFIRIRNAWVNPETDFGDLFGYTNTKWQGLISNYVDLNYLDLLKSQVYPKEKASAKVNYNISFNFSNSHGHGKGCLLSLTFIRRTGEERPILAFTLRASEVTKRLLLDLLLIQRMGEYVYDTDRPMIIEMWSPHIFATSESIAMYHRYKNILKYGDLYEGKFLERTIKVIKEFSKIDINTITYKVFARTARQLQKDKDDTIIKKHLYAKNLKLEI